eukprot:TRINITY_DN25833_c0_g1_i3.p1 TRINITY_DN25833_c0_g1~~TRINITY_DN25833_c0_g1_i3.p1  ORF type:complete len:173 (+),score=29.74 TRINITY_DN25833_c0_g1_i3:227-745(+)
MWACALRRPARLTRQCAARFSARGPSEDETTRLLKKPDGRVIELASLKHLRTLLPNSTVLDVRDVNEVAAAKGGVTVPGAVHAALNMDGIPQRVQPTSVDQYAQTLIDAGVELNPQSHASPFIVHCSGGGRAAKVVGFLKELGFEAVNGGSPDDVRSCWEQVQARQREQDRA